MRRPAGEVSFPCLPPRQNCQPCLTSDRMNSANSLFLQYLIIIFVWDGQGLLLKPWPFQLRFLRGDLSCYSPLGTCGKAISGNLTVACPSFSRMDAGCSARGHRGTSGGCGLLRHDSNLQLSCHIGNGANRRCRAFAGIPRIASKFSKKCPATPIRRGLVHSAPTISCAYIWSGSTNLVREFHPA